MNNNSIFSIYLSSLVVEQDNYINKMFDNF